MNFILLAIFCVINLTFGIDLPPKIILNLKTGLFTPQLNVSSKAFDVKVHSQRINHFDETDTRLFDQRYLEDCTFHKPGGPIILFVGGQEGLVPQFIESGPVRELAEVNNGCLLYPEHRYMGGSLPVPDLSVENLQYLKVNQVLADLKHLIETVKTNEMAFRDSKVILVGPSLSGTIVSWFRLKYPEMSVGGWASSGLIEAKADISETKIELGDLFKRYGGLACYNKIQNGFSEMEDDLKNGNLSRINKHLNLCDEFDPSNGKDNIMLINTLGGLFSALVASSNQHYIENMCESMINVDDNIQAIAVGLKDVLNTAGCLDMNYNTTIQILQNEYDVSGVRVFFYLACYEYGWFISCEAENHPFGTIVTFDYFVGMCRDIFKDDSITKETLYENAKRLNEEYGGLSANFTNLYSTQGLLDPHRILGLNKNVGVSAITEVIFGGTHANDLYYFFHAETGPIKKARLQAKLLVSKWLQE